MPLAAGVALIGCSNKLTTIQKLIANLLRVHREGAAEAAGKLQKLRAIKYRRVRITVLDRQQLESCCCECYAVVS